MSARLLSTRALATLLGSIPASLSAYMEGHSGSLLSALGPGAVLESRVPAGPPPVLLLPEGGQNHDAENARRIHRWLAHLTPVQASDARLWTFLTHSAYAEYTARRWPVDPDTEVAVRIRERYFVTGAGLSAITRNSIARLWWFGHLTHDLSRPDAYELTSVLLSLQDIQQAFMERTLGRSRRLLHTALGLWKRRVDEGGTPPSSGRVVQQWARLIRLHGAVVVLDALPHRHLENLLWIKLGTALNEDLPELESEEPL